MSMYEILSELRRKEEAKAWTEIDFPISLKEALERLTKVELDEIRKTYDFKGISSLNKADLIDKLVDLIPKHISRTLKWLDEERYSLIEKIIHNKGLLKVDGFDIKKLDSIKGVLWYLLAALMVRRYYLFLEKLLMLLWAKI